MKIALCLSGYLRSFKECYPSILENVIQDHDVDIFIHTYDKMGESKGWKHTQTGEILNEPVRENPIELGYAEFRPIYNELIDLNFLQNIPQVKVVAVERLQDIKYKFKNLVGNVSIFSNIDEIACILYKICECNNLRKQYELENHITYDLVIRTRGDQIFTKKINYNFPKEKILVNAYPWGDQDYIINDGGEDVCVSDRFAVGTPDNIDYLSDLYLHLNELFERHPITCSPIEFLVKYHLEGKIELEKRFLGFYVKHKPQRFKQ
jgi:hypothetical protein